MKTLQFKADIQATKEKVWSVLWDDSTYREWTRVFSEGSYAISDWKEGSKIHFLSPSGEGMFSRIDKMIPNHFMSFEHIGVLKNFEEQPQDEQTKSWSGAKENYTISEKDGHVELTVDLDIAESFADYFTDAFPKAMTEIKRLSEQ